jgi:hypothetical protein
MSYEEIPLKWENNKLIITPNKTEHAFVKVNSVDNAKFSGRYRLELNSNSTESITFTQDGKFQDNGVISILSHTYIECLKTSLAQGSGSYYIKNFTLYFTYANGTRIKIAVPGLELDKQNSSPSRIALSYNTDILNRQ